MIFPLWNSRGQASVGTFTPGINPPCQIDAKNAFRCAILQWPGYWFAYERPLVVELSWNGTLIDDKVDASGNLYRRNRYYDPNTGRFTQEDPIGLAGGLNAYGFANGDPVNYSDPFGLCPPEHPETLADCPVGVGPLVQLGRMSHAMNEAVAGFAAVSVAGGIGGAVVLERLATEAAAPVVEEAAGGATESAEALEPSEGQIQHFTRQLAKDGPSSVEKSIKSLQGRIEEHLGKLSEIRARGGNPGSVERELANFRRQIEAAQRVLGPPQ
jgi:RHS repeat-associated protein